MLYISLYATLLIRYRQDFSLDIWQNHYPAFSLVFVFWLFVFYIAGLYNLFFSQNDKIFFRSAFKGLAFSGIFAALFFYLNPNIQIAPKTNLALFLLVFSLFFFAWRALYNTLLNSYLPKNRVAFIGFNQLTAETIDFIKDNPSAGYKVVIIVNPEESQKKEHEGIKIISEIDSLKKELKQKSINTIVLSANPGGSEKLRQELFSSLSLKLDFINAVNFYENVIGKVPIEAINQMWFLENLKEANKSIFDRGKRLFDLLLALAIFIFSLPLWALIALAIKTESRGPVFFRQKRLNRSSDVFEIIKFRTMRVDNNDFAPTKKNDPRITKLGSFLRRSRLDELPQIINILKGEMSFVGPRPERPELVQKLEKVIPFYRERMLVKPGLTGWDQVSGEYHSPSEEDTLKKLQYDLYYVKNRSVYLDLSILLKTISVVLSRAGM